MNKLIILLLLITGIKNSIFAQVDVVYSKLVWSDEFDANGAIESSKWHHQTLLPNGNSWYNGELQHYTDLITNSFTNNGILTITAKKENYTHQSVTKNYTSARLNSKFAFTYGRVDVRAKMPLGAGVWPAIWLLGRNIIEPGAYFSSQYGTQHWPACGEIDIVECGIFPSEPVNYIGSAIHTTSSSGSTVNKGGRLANNLGTDFHVYSMNWSPNQITFLLDNVPYYTYKPTVKNVSTWPFDSPQYILLNIAMGGVAGTIPASFTEAKMEIDYVRIYQKQDSIAKDTLKKDIQPPQNLSAKTRNVSSTAVELLVKAEDSSNFIQFSAKHSNTALVTNGLSNIEKSIKIYNLTPNTDYIFEITAIDSSNNKSTPIALNIKTLPVPGCSGVSSSAQQGSFSIGYSYMFDPFGDELIVQYELLDMDKSGVVGFMLTKTPSAELTPSYVSGNKFTFIQKGLTAGSTQEYAARFAFAGGNVVSNYYTYKFSENCTSGIENSDLKPKVTFQNPVHSSLEFKSNETIDQVVIYNSIGQKLLTTTPENNIVDLSSFKPGLYHMVIEINRKIEFHKLIIQK